VTRRLPNSPALLRWLTTLAAIGILGLGALPSAVGFDFEHLPQALISGFGTDRLPRLQEWQHLINIKGARRKLPVR